MKSYAVYIFVIFFYLFASFLIILERFINFISITIIIIVHDKIDFDMVR